jgi:hypothetical protein
MEKLRATIEQYSRWKELELYIDRMEAHASSDFSTTLENAKALLETIGKEICSAQKMELQAAPSINAVLNSAFRSLGYSGEDIVKKVSGSLANIGQELGNLRNEISPTSHGKPLEELKKRNNKVDLLTREFLIDSTLVVAIFLIRAFEERKDTIVITDKVGVREVVRYDDCESFNNSWDDSFGEFSMGEYSYLASEILFNVDYPAYESEYAAFAAEDNE